MFIDHCSKMKVFISYAREDHLIAKKIFLALADENCEVFFDENSILSGNFRKKIMSSIDTCDIFIFLVSSKSLDDNKFVQSELSRIKQRLPSPNGKVIPIIIDEKITVEELSNKDIYLTSNHVVSLGGDITVKTVNAVNDARFIKRKCKLIMAVFLFFFIMLLIFLTYHSVVPNRADVELIKPKKIEFRTLKNPPSCGKKEPTKIDWLTADTALTAMNMTYSNQTPGKVGKVRVLDVKASLFIESAEPIEYEWFRIVDTRNNAKRESGSAWISDIATAGSFTLNSGSTRSDELLFKPIRYKSNPWKEFVSNQIMNNYPKMSVSISANIEYYGPLGNSKKWIDVDCKLIVKDETKKAFDNYLKRCERLPGYFIAHCQ